MTKAHWTWRLREALSAYLPLLLMAALALATWWLVNNTPMPAVAGGPSTPRQDPDYTMIDFTLQRYAKDGPLRLQIDGDRLRHYPATDMFEIDGVRLRAVAPDGRLTLASARRATVNGAGTEVRLLGAAEVRSQGRGNAPEVEMKSEFLHAFLDTERVQSHLPVWVRRGGTEVHADGFEYDHIAQLVQFKGKVRATIAPRAPGSAG